MSAEREIKIKNLEVIIPGRKNSRLRWKEFQILSLLVNRSPELVSRAEIIENIWKGTYCSDSTINQTIKSIRQKVGDAEHTLIRTIPRLGYKVDNKSIFHFISEAEPAVADANLSGSQFKGVNEEPLANDAHSYTEPDEIFLMGGEIVDNAPVTESYPAIKPTLQTTGQRAQASRWSRIVKYLTVFILLLTVSLLSYALGSRSKPAMQHELVNNARLVLSLDLPASAQPQALNCIYQKGQGKEMHVSCRAP